MQAQPQDYCSMRFFFGLTMCQGFNVEGLATRWIGTYCDSNAKLGVGPRFFFVDETLTQEKNNRVPIRGASGSEAGTPPRV